VKRASAAAAFLLLVLAAGGQEPGPYARYARGVAALEAGNPKQAKAELAIAAEGIPGQPEILYALSKADALSGDAAAALANLKRVVAMGYGTEAGSDPAFASLAELPGFRALAPEIAENAKPVSLATPAFTIPEADLIPEGIAWDPSGRRLFVGSLAKRKIVAISADGKVRDFVPSGRDEMQLVLGMRVDPAGGSLWACTADGDPPEGENKARRSALFRFDLATGRTLRRIPSPPGGRHLFNDLAITQGGEVYLTDSEAGTVYRLRPGSETFEPLAPSGTLAYPNGIALSGDGRLLYVAHDSGIRVWNLAERRDSPLAAPDAVTLAGIDGLSFRRGALIAVQNGLPPHRVALFSLAPSLDRVTGLRVLERGNPLFDIPTTGAVAGDAYFFMANTQLRALGPGGVVKEPEKRKPVVILRLDLP
jgi:sugar lactone lactonase YvrE